ncbi:DUF2061 domain-containing protein [Jeongeupia naejangsanensis]|uniref:DUF2061 domain-containing protein n=1 Tax=Jeongeupia naejangsanensis TaxID=613195 RepID=A0ABS2BIP1_9NEIS|nr:DUF2061 domain-containing protein [Jeongeupia naejangsanensis]MBM3114831.1 DUF2061 domain-containing protein [Jeongeupia naejangsanensis]
MIKTMTFAATHFSVAFAVAYALTGSFGVASLLALIEPMVNTVAYHYHEKIWERIRGCDKGIADAGHARLCGHGH